MIKYINFFLKFSKLQLLVILAITAFFGWHARRIRFDFTMERLFEEGSKERGDYDAFKKEFGGEDTTLYVAFKCVDPFSPAMLAHVEHLDGQLTKVPGVRDVFSVSDAVAMFPRGTSLDFIKGEIVGNSVFRGTITSTDGHTTCLWIMLKPDVDTEDERKETIDGIQAILAVQQRAYGHAFHVAGLPTIEHEYVNLVKRDILTFVPLAITLFFLFLCVYYRNLMGMVLPLATVLVAVVWSVGAMVLLGIEFSILSSIVPTLILILGVADTIHILSRYQEDMRAFPGSVKREAVARTIYVMMGACFLTSFTTAVGFASNATTRVGVINEFGWLAAGGIMLCYVVMLFFIPPCLDNLPPLRGKVLDEFMTGFSDRVLGAIARINEKHYVAVWVVAGVVTVLSILGMVRIRRESEWLQEMTKDNPVYQAHDFFDKNLNGVFSVDLLLDSGKPGGMTDPARLREIETLQRRAAEWKLSDRVFVRQTVSYVDFLKELNRARVMSAPQQAFERLASTPEFSQWEQLFRSLSAQDDAWERFTEDALDTARQMMIERGLPTGVLGDVARDLREFRRNQREAIRALVSGNAWLGLRAFSHSVTSLSTALSSRLVNLTEELKRAGLPDFLPQAPRTLPDSPEEVRDCLRIHERLTRTQPLMTRLVDDDRSKCRLTLRIAGLTSLTLGALERHLLAVYQEQRPSFKMTITGKAYLAKKAMDGVVSNMAMSLWIAGVIIGLSMVLLFRSVAVGLISIIPNALPLVCTAGFMGWLGIDLNFSTVTIFSVSLGIAVDTTIHYLTRLRLEVQQDNDHVAAMHRALRGAGGPMIFSTMLLVLGFSAILTSNFKFSFHFGLLGSFALVIALVSDLFITPTLMMHFKPKVTRWEWLEGKLKEIDEKLQKIFEKTKARLFSF